MRGEKGRIRKNALVSIRKSSSKREFSGAHSGDRVTVGFSSTASAQSTKLLPLQRLGLCCSLCAWMIRFLHIISACAFDTTPNHATRGAERHGKLGTVRAYLLQSLGDNLALGRPYSNNALGPLNWHELILRPGCVVVPVGSSVVLGSTTDFRSARRFQTVALYQPERVTARTPTIFTITNL